MYGRKYLTTGAVVACLLLVVAVFALTDKQVIHVFPTAVTSEGWMEETQALEQTLGEQALTEDFDTDNSAYVVFNRDASVPVVDDAEVDDGTESGATQGAWGGEETTSPDADTVPGDAVDSTEDGETVSSEPVDVGEQPVGEGEDVADDFLPAPVDVAPVSDEPQAIVPMPDISMTDYLHSVLRNTIASVARAQEASEDAVDIVPETDTTTPSENEQQDIAPIPDESTGTETSQDDSTDTEAPTDALPQVGGELPPASGEAPEEEPGDSVPEEERMDDVRVCRVLSIECHTLELSGFDIGSVLSEETVLSYELHASLGARSEADRFTDDKVLVRYFYRGRWHLAGEVSIQDETSNFTNGGHFTFALPNLSGWDALRDFRVEFEFVRASTVRTEVYLDAVWVESVYRAKSDTLPEFPDNVRAELVELEQSRRGDVLKTDEQTIVLPVRSMTPGNLVIRTNTNMLTSPGTEDVYLSVTNIGDEEKEVDLSFVMPDDASEPEYLRQWMNNVPEEHTVEEYGSMAHYCEGGWDMSPELPQGSYVCTDTLEDLPCDEINTDGTNCIEHQVRLGETRELAYVPGWHDTLLRDGRTVEDEGVFARMRKWFRFTGDREEENGTGYASEETYSLAPNQTLYFMARMKYPQISEGGFAVQADSGDETAVLDLGWKSAWRYRLPIVFDDTTPGDRVEITLTRDESPHLFAHVTDWGALFFREQHARDASWLPYTYTVFDTDTVTVVVDSTGLRERNGLYAYYGSDAGDTGLRSNATGTPADVVTADSDVAIDVDTASAVSEYSILAPQEVIVPDEPSHRLLAGGTADGVLPGDGRLTFAYRTNTLSRRDGEYAEVLSRGEFSLEEVHLLHESGDEVPDTHVIRSVENEWVLDTGMTERAFKPGKYTLTVRVVEGDRAYEEEQTFYWGVLTWNSTKSVYAPGETVVMQMGALSDTGHTLCNANLRLRIRDTQGVDTTVPVAQSGQCNGNTVVEVPDYSASYAVTGPGTYDVLLEELAGDGVTVIHAVTESITVEEATPYIIERTGPTRIYPVAEYSMTLRVSARNGYVGTVREAVPDFFEVSAYGDGRESVEGGVRYLEWDVALGPNETMDLSYVFDAPDISPYLYRIGPAQLGNEFTEYREWQIASDAVGNLLILWENATYVPTGWTCVSCTPGDPFYQRFIMGSSTYNTTGGATTHTHTGNGTVYVGGSGATENFGSGAIADVGHGHTYTPTISSDGNMPPYRQLRVLQYTASAGEPTTLPAGAIVYFDASVPTGWTRYSAQDGYYVYGENTPGTTGGTSTHTHTVSGSTGASTGSTYASRGGTPQSAAATAGHTHTISGTTGSINHEPPYIGTILGQLSATSSLVNGMIGMWTADVPSGWITVSSSSEAFSNKFARPAATYGTTGGTSTHAHSNVTGLTSSTVNDTTGRSGSSGVGPHNHSVDVTGISTTGNLPPYATAVFGKRFSNDPLYTQNYYRFYGNTNAEPPTDPWPVGASNLAENTRISTTDYTSKGDVIRIRMSVQVTNATSTAYTDAFTLQYAPGSSCSDIGLVWRDVGDIASTTAPWRGYNNASVVDGATTSSTTLSVSDVFETYEEENPSASTTNTIAIGQDGEWDWVVQHHEALPGTDYCFRMARSNGTPLSGYNNYPQLITDQAPTSPTSLTPFDNEKVATVTPVFTFVTSDPEGDSIHYQVQVSTDYLFGSMAIDADSITSSNDFDNLDTPADKAPFNSGDRMQFQSGTALSNNATYWWRVRGQDPTGSGQWGSWSTPRSFTASTSVTISTWHQTTDEQFDTDTYTGTDSNGSDQVTLITGSTTGSLVSSEIDYDWKTSGNAWGSLSFTDTETSSDLKYQVEFYDTTDSTWKLIPDSALSGNSTGFDTSPVSLLTLDTTTYNRIRLKATFTNSGASPVLSDWTVEWGTRVAQPTQSKLFDNEKTGTTTPTFEFVTTDPQSDDLVYEISWSTDYTFTSGTTSRISDTHGGFLNTASSTDTSPFVSGNTIRFTVQGADALTNTTTYWWRVRARDPSGGNAWSEWSERRSFTIDTTVIASTWYQTTNEQFTTGSLFGLTTSGNAAVVATSVQDVLIAYGEGTVTTPRYRLWNGSAWGSELSALDVGAAQYNIITRAHPNAEIYALATIGTDADVNVQIYRDGAWGDLQEMTTTVGNATARGADITFETTSGDLMAVYCDGDADPSYRIYNESTGWGSAGAVNLSSTNNCEWIRLASDPTSDEIIVVSVDTAGGQYEAQVWNGSSWGNATVMGSMQSTGNEGMAVAYEESGNQAIVVVSDGNPARFRYNTWNGTTWGTAATQSIGNDFEWGNLTPDVGTDAMALCYVDEDSDIGVVHWTGSAWTSQAEIETVGNASTDRPVDCSYETNGSRNGYVMTPYSDDTNVRYQSWNGAAWSGEASISTITDAATVQSARSDDGLILTVSFDDVNGQYDFSYWNGSSWSSAQTLEDTPSVTGAPWREPFMMTPRNSAVQGTLYSPTVDFNDGSGPQWNAVSWTDSEPGGSTLTYQVQYYDTASSSWKLVPDSAIPGNSSGTSTSPIDISGLNTTTYNELRIKANFACNAGVCPTLSDWTITWSEGFTVSGIAKQYDQTTNVTSGTVAIAVNGSLQIGKTGTISGGTWIINNINAFQSDVITVWIDGVGESNEAVAVTRYDGTGPIAGMTLYERHLGIGSDDNPTLSNILLGSFDASASGDEDIFFDVDGSNNLYVCEAAQPSCGHEQLWIRNGSTFAPATSTVEFIYTNDVDIEGTLTGSGNTFEVSGSWTNAGIFSADTSTVIFDATSTTEILNSSAATTSSFYHVTFGQGSSTATWTLASPLDINGTLTLTSGTLAPGAGYSITIADDLIIGSSGNFTKSTGTTTFDGTGASQWSDASSPHEDMGTVVVNGTSKTISLLSDTKATTHTIGSDDILALGGYTLELTGSFYNTGSLVPQSGRVLFTSTATGNEINAGASSFYDLSFNGTGGNWAFPNGAVTATNDFTITNGQVIMPTGTTTIGGSLAVTGGTFVHNNGAVVFNSTLAKTITASTSPFYNLSYTGTGSWVMQDTNATSSNDVTLTNGIVTLPSGTFAVGGSFTTTGGSFNHASGTVRLYSTGTENVSANTSPFYNLTVAGSGGNSTVTNTNLTIANNLLISAGNINLPTGTLTIQGSLDSSSGMFYHSTGTVNFTASTTGKTVTVGSSNFYDVRFTNTLGGWTVAGNTLSVNDWSIVNATSFTAPNGGSIEVRGDFTNSIGGSATTWTGSTLYLNAGTTTSMNASSSGGDVYDVLHIGSGTHASMWNSSASTYTVDVPGSLYSQDHAAVNGDLYIWGSYERQSGTEYWSWSRDFDGTTLSGGNERQVDVRFANGAYASVTRATFDISGTSTATTSIDNQGSGTYTVTLDGGTLSARYFSFAHLASEGLTVTGSSSVLVLRDGYFELGVNGGTLLRVSSSTIDANPAKQFDVLGFATTSSITGTNVAVIGTAPVSYWTFRDHYGNLDGEMYDNDPGGDPGNVRWDDSAFDITVSGTVYSGIGSGVPAFCNGSTPVVYLKVDGVGSYSASCAPGTGIYTIPNIDFSGDAVLTAYLKTSGTTGATVTKTPNGDILNLDIYEHTLIVRHEDVVPLSIADLATFDADIDTDLPFTAATGTPDTLSVEPDNGLYVWTGTTFTPDGNTTLISGGSGTIYDGTLWLGATSTFTASGAESHSIGGSWIADPTSVFNRAQSTVTFTATTSGKTIAPASNFENVIINGSGGAWSIASSTTVRGSLTAVAGTLGGTGDVTVYGLVTGNGTIAMSDGTFTLLSGGLFGGNTAWMFNDLIFSTSTATSSTKSGSGNITVAGTLTIGANNTLEAGSVEWLFSGSGTVFVPTGTFNPQTSTTTYNGSLDLTIPATNYYTLNAAPTSGTPTYTIAGGNFTVSNDMRIGGGSTVTVQANTNDPLITVLDDVTVSTGATYHAASSNDLLVGGSFDNNGTFSANAGGVVFNSTDTGETVAAGNSAFHHAYFTSTGGGWTLTESATSTGNFSISSSSAWTLGSGNTLTVQGIFTNNVGGGATTWTGSTLYLNSGTGYSINSRTVAGDTYGTLLVGANTDVRMWYSTSTSYTVHSTGSLYSQDHGNVNGNLYIWGDYTKATGNDYWSYATDFDGTSLTGGSERKVDVYVANGATLARSGGTLAILGTTTASTTITHQGSGSYAFSVSGGTLNAGYYELRNMNSSGLNLSGSPTVTSLSDGDFELSANGGTLMTLAGSVITANPLKIMYRNRFATTSGVTGTNVLATGVTGSSWRFTSHYGSLDGEGYDSDPGGDPGYVIWDDSAAQITISGTVYGTDETSVSPVCDGSTQVVRFLINGANPQTTSCNAGTGYYQFTGIVYNVGDVFTVYLNDTSAYAANVTADPITNITDMHLYADRLVVRHEGVDPVTIGDLDAYDADQDTDIPFDADTGSPGTLTLDPGSKLVVWSGKSLAPGGNVIVASLGSGTSYDGTVELKDNATFVAAGTESHTVGGSFISGSGASLTAANSTFTFTATTTGKTIDTNTGAFANLVYSGAGGAWTFLETAATTTGDVTISAGSVVLPTSSFAVGGSFINSAVFTGTTTAFVFTAAGTETITFAGYSVGSLYFTGTGPWTMSDTNATTTGSFLKTSGTLTLPGGTLSVRTSFDNMGGLLASSGGTIRLYGSDAAQTITTTGSSLGNLTIAGSGSWAFVDTDATTTGSVHIASGGLTAPSGTLTIGGSLVSSSTFSANAGTLIFNATTTGNTIYPGGALLGSLFIQGVGGGWTVATSATTTGDLRLVSGTSLTMATGTVIEVGGQFRNSIGGTATDWTNSTLYLNASGTSYNINSKTATGDMYAFLTVGNTTNVAMWQSSAATTTIVGTGSLYSQDHAGNDGNLYIYGPYVRTNGTEYWSYATDFDGTALGGGSRQVNVRIASSSSVTIQGSTLDLTGVSGNLTTVDVQVGGSYGLTMDGGTITAEHYRIRSTNSSGLVLSNSPSVTTLNNGEFELTTQGGSMMTVSSDTITANPSRTFTGISFSTTTGISSGYNITLTGSTSNIWQFTGHSGNYDGESYDNDGVDACGQIRWSDSACLEVSQTHYRFRNDDGGEAAPDSEWYNLSWSKRKPITLTNLGGPDLTDYVFKVVIPYDADMQADFDDLRFTDGSGTTSLAYWFESVSLNATATAWVKIPSVVADEATRLFVYYGNALATSSENGSNVFTFFDDFEDNAITEYSGSVQDLSYFSTNASYGWEGSYGLSASGGNTDKQTNGGIYRTVPSFGQGSTIRFYQKITAGTDDEPCTLFGVQGSGQNYAVCLDQYPTDRVIISEDVRSNSDDGTGTELASTSVNWLSGWYEVEVDWLTDDSINVTVYDASGSVFATTSVTDTSYTSGGMGFTFWYQSEGWDFYSVRPYVADEPSYRVGMEQGDNGASWKAAQDSMLIGQPGNENFRIRFGVENTGTTISGQTWRLQYASKTGYGSCEAVPDVEYSDAPNAAGCGTSPVCMTTSPNITDQEATTEHLVTQFDGSFSAGMMVESPSNQTGSSTLLQDEFTEVEYSVEFTDFATDSSYCFRTTNAGVELDTYLLVAEASVLFAPVISDWKLNNDEPIALIEGETTTVYATGTISDLNGWEDILYATSTIYRSGVGEWCLGDLNNCYRLNSLECPLQGCSGNSCTVECSVEIQYFAEPTDDGTYSGEHWEAGLFVVDGTGNIATTTSPVDVDVLTLWGMAVTSGQIAYGTLNVGEDTGSANATSTVRNTGNSAIDIRLAGSDMTAPGSSIPVANQKFATSTFSYSACVICGALSGTASTLEVDLVKPTSTSTAITDDLYWGIYVPIGTGGQTHYGQNTFYATGD